MIIYTKTVCPKCMLLISELTALNFTDYKKVNIDQDEAAKIKVMDAGFMTVPVIEFEGQLTADTSSVLAKINELLIK